MGSPTLCLSSLGSSNPVGVPKQTIPIFVLFVLSHIRERTIFLYQGQKGQKEALKPSITTRDRCIKNSCNFSNISRCFLTAQ